MFPSRQDHGLAYLPSNFILQLCGHIWSMLAKFGTPPYYLSRSVHCLSFVRPYAHTNKYFYSFFPHTVSLWNNLPYDVVSTVPFSTFKCCILMYASLSLELLMHPLLVLFTWQKHFRKKTTWKSMFACHIIIHSSPEFEGSYFNNGSTQRRETNRAEVVNYYCIVQQTKIHKMCDMPHILPHIWLTNITM